MESHGSKIVVNDDLIYTLRQKKRQRIENEGSILLVATSYGPSTTTLNDYKTLVVVNSHNITISNTTISKSSSRYTLNNSLISSMVLLLIVTATHYIIVEEKDQCVRINTHDDTTSKGVKILYKIISKTYVNLSIIPIKPQYIFQSMILLYIFLKVLV